MKISVLFSLAAALIASRPVTAQAVGRAAVWEFPGDASHYFMLNHITPPAQWANEMYVILEVRGGGG